MNNKCNPIYPKINISQNSEGILLSLEKEL